jgi:hypothetical protein
MKNTILIILGMFVLIQLIPSQIENKPVDRTKEIKVTPEMMAIFKRSCYDCHSDEVKIPWYASIAPASFFIKGHVDLGRQWLNFSIWETYTEKEKDKKLKGIFRTVYKAMPLESYISIHKDAKLTQDEIRLIRDWTGKAPF